MAAVLRNTDLAIALRKFGAIGNGVHDDTDAIMRAFASGEKLTGRGRTYAVSGNLSPTAASIELDDATFLQLDPNNSSRKTLEFDHANGVDSVTLRRVVVNRNGATTDGAINGCVGVYCHNVTTYLEDVEVYGDGNGTGISVQTCTRPRIIRPHIHDMRWGAASDPGSEHIVGLNIGACTDVYVEAPRIYNLTGEITWAEGQVIGTGTGTQWRVYNGNAYTADSTGTTGATPPTHTVGTESDGGVDWTYVGPSADNARAYNADGIDFVGCTNVDVYGGVIDNVWESVDITGSGSNRNVWLHGVLSKNADAYGFKFAHKVYDSGAKGCVAVGAGLAGFVCGAGNDAADRADNILWEFCQALDIGAVVSWAASTKRAGFQVGMTGVDTTTVSRGVVARHCLAKDRQGSPTMQHGFHCETSSSTNFRTIFCESIGHTTAQFTNVPAHVDLLAADGSFTVTGPSTVTGALTASTTATVTTFFITPGAGLTLANGLNSNVSITTSYSRITGPTGAFSLGGLVVSGGNPSGCHAWVENRTSQNMTIVNNDGSSTDANRIRTMTGADVVHSGQSAAHFIYNTADQRWALQADNS